MSSPALFEMQALLQPIPGKDPGADPAGRPVDYLDFRAQFKELTTEHNPEEYDPGTPGREKPAAKADWQRVLELARKTLIKESKDLEVAGRFTQALTLVHRFTGLREGLDFLRQLVDQCWDRLHPPLYGDNPSDRLDVLTGILDDPSNSLRNFPDAVRSVPLVNGDTSAYGLTHMRQAGTLESGVSKEEVHAAIQRAKMDECVRLDEEVKGCLAALDELHATLTAKMPSGSFSMMHLRQAIEDCAGGVQQIIREKGGTGQNGASQNGDQGVEGSGHGMGNIGAATNREAVFEQLELAARALERMEPGSPVPFLIRRAIKLGRLPFPELIRAMLQDQPAAHTEVDRLLGLTSSEQQQT